MVVELVADRLLPLVVAAELEVSARVLVTLFLRVQPIRSLLVVAVPERYLVAPEGLLHLQDLPVVIRSLVMRLMQSHLLVVEEGLNIVTRAHTFRRWD